MASLRLMIGNAWREGGAEPFVSVNPADGSEAARVACASSGDVDQALAAARGALDDPAWAGLKAHERARFLYRLADLVAANEEIMARAQMADNGKTIGECRAQARSAAGAFRYYGAVCETFEGELTTQRGPSLTVTVYEPVGVVAAITPWNSPLTLEAQKLAPILAAGSTVVLKPSEVTPQVALEYARLAIEAELPAGVVNVVTGDADVGRLLVNHRDVDMVTFTGGTDAGRAIAERCGRELKRVTLELGGKSPHVVFENSEYDRALRAVGSGIFGGGGQSCIAGSRVFVQESMFDGFLRGLTELAGGYRLGQPQAPETTMGPLASFAHREKVAGMVAAARDEGARIVCGGTIPVEPPLDRGAYFPPTIITNVTNQAPISRNEIFGPVAVVLPFRDEEDLVAQANDSAYGLAAGIWTNDTAQAWRVARALRAGTVWINTYKEASISTPFGGFKQSGLGREKGRQGVRAYMEPKGIFWNMS